MRKLLWFISIFLTLFLYKAKGDHIVGGEILIEHLHDFDYRIKVNIYRDGTGILPPLVANIGIYKRGTGGLNPNLQRMIAVPLVSNTPVQSFTPACQNSIIDIERWYYEDDISLDPDSFSDPSGYLFVWRSCCRNRALTNLLSPLTTGQVITTLFPPIRDLAGGQVINSSPKLSEPIAEYACVGQLFYMDFGGADPDGDSLAYEMFTPRDYGTVTGGTMTPDHAPYADPLTMLPSIPWAQTFSADDAVHGYSGPPDPAADRLRVDAKTGLLTAVPRNPGVHLFGVWCKEFRDLNGDGKKELIGSVYRDFQLPVVGGCSFPDTLDGPILANGNGLPGDTIHVTGDMNEREVCFKIWDSDYSQANPIGMNANFKVVPENFPEGFIEYTPKSYTFSGPNDTVDICIKFLGCAQSFAEPLKLKIVTAKGNCPLPHQDSTEWFFTVDSVPYVPSTVHVDTFDYDPAFIQFPSQVGVSSNDTIAFFQIRPQWNIGIDFITIDTNNQSVVQYLMGDGFNAINAGMKLFYQNQSDTIIGSDTIRAKFRWDPGCRFFQHGKGRVFLVTLDKFCNEAINVREIHFEILKENVLPSLIPKEVKFDSADFSFTPFDPISRPDTFMTFEIHPNQEIEFTLLTLDSAADSLVQYLEGVGYNPYSQGMEFFNATQNRVLVGRDSLISTFRWKPQCQFANEGGGQVNLITEDRFCAGRAITRPIYFKIIPELFPAKVELESSDYPNDLFRFPGDDQDTLNDTFMVFRIRPNWTINFDLLTEDSLSDTLVQFIEGVGFNSGEVGMKFFNDQGSDTLTGVKNLGSSFSWTPDCDLFTEGGGKFHLITEEKYCQENRAVRTIYFEFIRDNHSPRVVGKAGENPDRTEEFVSLKDQYFEKQVGESLVFDYFSSDGDRDQISIYFKYKNLDPEQTLDLLVGLGISIENRSNNPGDSSLVSTFSWFPKGIDCEMFERYNENSPLQFFVYAVDSSCLHEKDSSLLTIEINDGTEPYFQVKDEQGEQIEMEGSRVRVRSNGSELRFSVIGRDEDILNLGGERFRYDDVKLSFSPHGFNMEEKGVVTEPFHIPEFVPRSDSVEFIWNPECEDRNSDPLKIHFTVEDRSCQGHSNELNLWVEAETLLEFPNVITPNGDGANDFLELENSSQICGFRDIQIFNRWGQEIFSSSDRDFSFDAKGVPPGDYYYYIRYENRTLTQTLKVIK